MNHHIDPARLLKNEWVQVIRQEAKQAEKDGKLTKKQLELIYDQQWFKMLVPAIYGGKQMPLPEVLQIEEALACADGSLGWIVTLCSGAGWFGGHMQSTIAPGFLKKDDICIAGSGALAGTAERTASGYVVNGKWSYATGAPEATAFTANCLITEMGSPVKDSEGNNMVLSFIFPKNEVKILPTWNAMGMVATTSNSFSVTDIAVDSDRAFSASEAKINAALYNYPFKQLAEATLSVNMSGMAFHFIELCDKIFSEGNRAGVSAYTSRPMLKDTIEAYSQKLQMARQKLYYAVDMSWQICTANKAISASVLYKVSAASFTLTKVVRESVNALFQYCGLDAADKDSDINRVLRNLLTAGQHSMLIGDGSA